MSLYHPIVVCDTRGPQFVTLDYTPDVRSGFMYFQGYLREIRDIHRVKSGCQIELYPHYPYGLIA